MDELESGTPQGQDNTADRGDNSDLAESPPPPPKHCHSYHGPKPTPPWWRRLSVWQFFFEILIFIVTVRIAWIYSDQLDAMLKANFINKQAADATTSAANTARDTLNSSNQSFKQDERAYVATTLAVMSNPPECNIPGSRRVCVDIHAANSGRTPAIGLRLHRYATFGENARANHQEYAGPRLHLSWREYAGEYRRHIRHCANGKESD
jgi:hypothetical protein